MTKNQLFLCCSCFGFTRRHNPICDVKIWVFIPKNSHFRRFVRIFRTKWIGIKCLSFLKFSGWNMFVGFSCFQQVRIIVGGRVHSETFLIFFIILTFHSPITNESKFEIRLWRFKSPNLALDFSQSIIAIFANELYKFTYGKKRDRFFCRDTFSHLHDLPFRGRVFHSILLFFLNTT